jgi:hypothetical protein
MAGLWVARLHISYRTAQKIINRHQIDIADVNDAVVCKSGLRYVVDDDPDRGRRLIVEALIADKKALVVLYPKEDPMGDAYNLGSVYFDG